MGTPASTQEARQGREIDKLCVILGLSELAEGPVTIPPVCFSRTVSPPSRHGHWNHAAPRPPQGSTGFRWAGEHGGELIQFPLDMFSVIKTGFLLQMGPDNADQGPP